MATRFTGVMALRFVGTFLSLSSIAFLQIIPPIDKGIAKSIEDHLEVWPESWSTEIMKTSPDLCLDPYDDVYKSYYSDLTQYAQHRYRSYIVK